MTKQKQLYYTPSQTLQLAEWHVYGSTRFGIYKANKPLAKTINETIVAIQYQTRIKYRYNGNKQYELTNHLGNVLVTISDRRKAICNEVDSTLSYQAVVVTATDYYSFGSPMVGRSYEGDTSLRYRYSFNGYEKDDEIKGAGNHISFEDYGYDPRVVVRWLPDPLTAKYPHISPYAAFGNNPILYVDVDGKEIWIAFEAKKADGTTEIQKVQYKGDKLYTADGKEYTGGNEFAVNVLKDLNQLKADDAVLKERTLTLETSKQIHTIQMTDGPDKGNSNSPLSQSNDEKGIPTGSTTKYNPDKGENVSGDKRTPHAGLAHELLGHGWDSDQGKADYSKTENGIPMYEVNAVNIENRARAAAGDEKKTTYGGKDIPAKLLDDTHKKKEE